MIKPQSFLSGPLAAALALLAFVLVANREPRLESLTAQAASQSPVKLTSTLVAWISSQAEAVIEELEAIAAENAASNQFSVVNYIRYLALFEDLKVIANRKDVDKLQWVAKKVKALSKAHASAVEILTGYLTGLDFSLSKIEANEPKSKQVEVSNDWMQIYQTINYIATHVSVTTTRDAISG